MPNVVNKLPRDRALRKRRSANRIAFCLSLAIGLILLPDSATAQAQFRQPRVPQQRTLGKAPVETTALAQERLQSIIPNVSSGVPTAVDQSVQIPANPRLISPLAPSGTAESSPPNLTPTNSISEFGDGGFLAVELGKGGLTHYRPAPTGLANATQSQPSATATHSGSSPAANAAQETEELPSPLFIQEEFDTAGLEEIRQNFPDGSPRIIRYVAQDEQGNYYNHGPWKAYNQAQPPEIVASGTYREGRMHGLWRRQHDAGSGGLFATKPFDLFKGPFLSVATFRDGYLDGVWSIYDPYQRNIFEISYKDGKRNGTATWWYPNRAKMREATFKDGLLHGEILAWDESQQLIRREEFVEGRRVVRNTTFYRPNQKQTEDYYLDAKLVPEGEDSWWEAKPTPYIPQGDRVQNGTSMKWYENKQPKQQGQYKDGNPVGQFTWWHANGNKQIEGFFDDGKKNRLWTWWYENGMKQFEGMYEDDVPIGHWRSWDSDGQLRKEETFSKTSENPEPTVIDRAPDRDERPETNSIIEPPTEKLPDPPGSDTTTVVEPPAEPRGKDAKDTRDLEGIDPLEPKRQPTDKDAQNQNDAPQDNGANTAEDGSLPAKLFKK